MGLASMIKAAAQMKNLRRGKDTQGYLKKINLDSSSEGYSNFMAPLRMKMVEADAKYARKHSNAQDVEKVFNKDILRPSTDTYVTPEWDEFVPFPTSKSTYFSHSQISLPVPLSNRVTDIVPSQHGKSASTASGAPTTVGTKMGLSAPSSKSPSPASLTTSHPSTNLKAPVNTAAPSPTRRACATVPEWCVGANTVLATMRSRWIRLQTVMSK